MKFISFRHNNNTSGGEEGQKECGEPLDLNTELIIRTAKKLLAEIEEELVYIKNHEQKIEDDELEWTRKELFMAKMKISDMKDHHHFEHLSYKCHHPVAAGHWQKDYNRRVNPTTLFK